MMELRVFQFFDLKHEIPNSELSNLYNLNFYRRNQILPLREKWQHEDSRKYEKTEEDITENGDSKTMTNK